MANYLTDDAICLRVTDFSETSQVVALFTRAHGLVPMIAKGSKRVTKKNTMSGPLDLLTSGEVVFVPAKGAAELATLTGWELANHRALLRSDLAALNAALMGAEITTSLMHPHDPHEALFEELEATLELLPTPQRPRALVAYAKSALDAAGYAPQLDACLVCARPLGADVPVRFYPRAGGFACPGPPEGPGCELAGNNGAAIRVAGRIVIALNRLPSPRGLQLQSPGRPADLASLAAALQLLLGQIESLTDRPLRTRYLVPEIFGRPTEKR